jgi:hypothetical protein
MSLQEYMKILPWFKRVQPRVWQLFEEPYSSSAAKVKFSLINSSSMIIHLRLFKLFQSFLYSFQ